MALHAISLSKENLSCLSALAAISLPTFVSCSGGWHIDAKCVIAATGTGGEQHGKTCKHITAEKRLQKILARGS